MDSNRPAVVEHITFGVVTNPDGQKLSSRDGTPYTLKQLLDEAVDHTKKAIQATRSLLRSDRHNLGAPDFTEQGTFNIPRHSLCRNDRV